MCSKCSGLPTHSDPAVPAWTSRDHRPILGEFHYIKLKNICFDKYWVRYITKGHPSSFNTFLESVQTFLELSTRLSHQDCNVLTRIAARV